MSSPPPMSVKRANFTFLPTGTFTRGPHRNRVGRLSAFQRPSRSKTETRPSSKRQRTRSPASIPIVAEAPDAELTVLSLVSVQLLRVTDQPFPKPVSSTDQLPLRISAPAPGGDAPASAMDDAGGTLKPGVVAYPNRSSSPGGSVTVSMITSPNAHFTVQSQRNTPPAPSSSVIRMPPSLVQRMDAGDVLSPSESRSIPPPPPMGTTGCGAPVRFVATEEPNVATFIVRALALAGSSDDADAPPQMSRPPSNASIATTGLGNDVSIGPMPREAMDPPPSEADWTASVQMHSVDTSSQSGGGGESVIA